MPQQMLSGLKARVTGVIKYSKMIDERNKNNAFMHTIDYKADSAFMLCLHC